MFKQKILSKYLGEEEILFVISHHWWVYLKLILLYSVVVLILLLMRYGIVGYIDGKWLSYIFGLIGVLLYIKFAIAFFDLYLDSIVLTPQGIHFFLWEGIFSYSDEIMEWGSIESVYGEQNGLLDIILNKGDIIIKRVNEEYRFLDVPDPNKLASEIMDMKGKILNSSNGEENDEEGEEKEKDSIDNKDEKIEIIVEALSEILKEYIKK